MQDVRLAVAQFMPTDVDKETNLAKIAELTTQAAEQGAEIVCFQEQTICGYNLWGLGDYRERDGAPGVEEGRLPPDWTQRGAHPYELAESVPDGPSEDLVQKSWAPEKRNGISLQTAGLRPWF